MDNELLLFLRDENIRAIASKTPTLKNSIMDTLLASDFDVFNALCENIYLLAGHPMRDELLSLFRKYSSIDVTFEVLYDLEFRKALWQKIFVDDSIIPPKTFGAPDVKMNLFDKKADNAFSINSVLDGTCENIYLLLDKTLNKIKTDNADALYLDARNIVFARPDDYHAQRDYEALKTKSSDGSLALLWLLCRILMNADLELILSVDSAKKAEDILALIYRLGLSSSIRLLIDVSNFDGCGRLYKLLMLYSKKNISLELYCNKENINMLIEFLNTVPLVFVRNIDAEPTFLRNLLSSGEADAIIPL